MAALRSVYRVTLGHLTTGRVSVPETCAKNFSMNTSLKSAYDADGKTVINILNNEEDAPLMINSYNGVGFRLNNGCFVIGPIAIFPQSILSWNVQDDNDIHEKSLSLFLRLFPKLDVLLIGLSDPRNVKLLNDTRNNIRKMLGDIKQGNKMTIEVLPTEKAIPTFNFMNSERRFVAAALVPPIYYTPTLEDQYRIDYLNKRVQNKDVYLS